MKNKIRDKIDKDLIEFRSNKILLAHSGGVDSSVLAHVLLDLKIDFSIVHCNFQLRGTESENDLNFVSKWSKENKISFFHSKFAKIKK